MTSYSLPPWQWRARGGGLSVDTRDRSTGATRQAGAQPPWGGPAPAEAAAAVAWGDAAARLHALLVRESARDAAAASHRWSASASRDVLMVLGEPATLPWVDGVAYAAPCADAPALWLPTLWEPDLPGDLVERALHRLHGRQPLLLWRQPLAVVPLDRLLPATPALLARIKEHWHGPAT